MRPAFLLALPVLAFMSTSSAASADPLAPHRWRSRLLVVIAPVGDGRVAEQRALYESARAGARERDLVWFDGTGQGAEAGALRRRFGVGDGEFRAILVGKDGGEKLASDAPLASARLFEEIDAMPMRRSEMKGGGR